MTADEVERDPHAPVGARHVEAVLAAFAEQGVDTTDEPLVYRLAQVVSRAERGRLAASPPPVETQYAVEAGWLVLVTGQHTCAGGTPESGYAHEPSCGLEPLERVEVLAPLLVPEAEERGRQRGVQPFRDLFSGGPDTSCRTTYRESAAAPECSAAAIDCVEVPLDDLRAAFVEAGDPES